MRCLRERWAPSARSPFARYILDAFDEIEKLQTPVGWLLKTGWGLFALVLFGVFLIVLGERARTAKYFATVESQQAAIEALREDLASVRTASIAAQSKAEKEVEKLRSELAATAKNTQFVVNYETSKVRLASLEGMLNGNSFDPDRHVINGMEFSMFGKFMPWLSDYKMNLREIRETGLRKKGILPEKECLTEEDRRKRFSAEMTEVQVQLKALCKRLTEDSQWPLAGLK
jgi:hypothetical protein